MKFDSSWTPAIRDGFMYGSERRYIRVQAPDRLKGVLAADEFVAVRTDGVLVVFRETERGFKYLPSRLVSY